jgi:hypothetical protein
MGLVIKGAECVYAECTRCDWIWPGPLSADGHLALCVIREANLSLRTLQVARFISILLR